MLLKKTNNNWYCRWQYKNHYVWLVLQNAVAATNLGTCTVYRHFLGSKVCSEKCLQLSKLINSDSYGDEASFGTFDRCMSYRGIQNQTQGGG